MSIGLIIQAIIAVLKFPDAMSAFIKLVSKTPAEKQADIVKRVNVWMDESASSERPKWNQ